MYIARPNATSDKVSESYQIDSYLFPRTTQVTFRQLCPAWIRVRVLTQGRFQSFPSSGRAAWSSSDGAERIASSTMITPRLLSSANLRNLHAPQAYRYVSRIHLFSRRPHTAQRIFASFPLRRKEQPSPAPKHAIQDGLPSKADQAENVRPETMRKSEDQADRDVETDPLLSEQSVSNREQRKADWAIMKEMSRYLWPKVGLRICRL